VEEDVFHPVRATHGMVASVDALATHVGVDILKQGGNAVDAAVAVGYALAVTHPQAGNLGGGGFMMLRTKDGKTTAIDFREMAPAQASRDMFLDDQGNPDSKKSLTSHLASGTPGTVAGFSLAYSLATAVFGGFTPVMSTALIEYTGDKASPGYWMSFAAVCALLATLYLYRRRAASLQNTVKSQGAA
jgi:hypothetical protein